MKVTRISWNVIVRELKKRWLLVTIVGIYLTVGILFGVLIYRFHWDQSSTHWAARVFPLPAARVNGQMIWLSSYYRRLAIFDHYAKRVEAEEPDLLPDNPAERRSKTLDQLIDIAILKQEARKANITLSDKEITDSFAKVTETNGGEDNFKKVLEDFYGINPAQFSLEFIPEQLYREKLQDQLFTQIKVRHIVVKDESAARDVLAKAKNGDDFGELAKNTTQDLTSREQGGDLGWIRRGQLTKPFEDAAFGLKTGDISPDLVQTEFGYHIIKVEERKDGPINDKPFTEWFDALRTDAQVTRFVAKAPPVEPTP